MTPGFPRICALLALIATYPASTHPYPGCPGIVQCPCGCVPVGRTGSGLHWAGLCAVSMLLCVSTAFPLDFPTDATGWALHLIRPSYRRSLPAVVCRFSLPMPMRLKCCGGRMRSRHDGNNACFCVGRKPGTAALSALHLAASKRVAHHSPQRSAPCPIHTSRIASAVHAHQAAAQGADRWAGYASHSPLINWLHAAVASGHSPSAAKSC
jgi:hypothetical protein